MRSMFRVVRYTFSVALRYLECDMCAHADLGSFRVTLVVDGVWNLSSSVPVRV